MPDIKAPGDYSSYNEKRAVFLAGSIDQGKAIDWQSTLTNLLQNEDVLILNPRRSDWDTTWVQDISNPQFREQVEWELDAMERADVIAMYFDADQKSPITLLELGLHASSTKLVVCCPEGFWRKGNVQVVCARYGITMVDTIEELCALVRIRLG